MYHCYSNWMILRDADTGKVIWQENKDLSSCEAEHEAKIPTKILDLRAVSREINFSTVESIENFRLHQKVSVVDICLTNFFFFEYTKLTITNL